LLFWKKSLYISSIDLVMKEEIVMGDMHGFVGKLKFLKGRIPSFRASISKMTTGEEIS